MKEYIKKNFLGTVLIVDDEVDKENTKANYDEFEIVKIREYLISEGFGLLKYTTIPNNIEEIIGLERISFIICDWSFGPTRNEDENAKTVINFLNKITEKVFVPIFICSNINKDTIKSYLVPDEQDSTKVFLKNYKDDNSSSVFIVNKKDVLGELMYSVINQWLEKNYAVNVMKKWECAVNFSKNKVFNSLYKISHKWPLLLHSNFKADGTSTDDEISRLLMKNLESNFSTPSFDIEDCAILPTEVEDYYTILQNERFLKYESALFNNTTQFKLGDIFEKDGEFFINIRRECDLITRSEQENKQLYLLKCSIIKKLADAPIKLVDYNKIKVHHDTINIKNSQENINSINKSIDESYKKTKVFYEGKILEKSNEVIIPYMIDNKIFSIELKNVDIKETNQTFSTDFKRVGRLLEPYINIVVNKFSYYVASLGMIRDPRSLSSTIYAGIEEAHE